jgi:hypothetical protein
MEICVRWIKTISQNIYMVEQNISKSPFFCLWKAFTNQLLSREDSYCWYLEMSIVCTYRHPLPTWWFPFTHKNVLVGRHAVKKSQFSSLWKLCTFQLQVREDTHYSTHLLSPTGTCSTRKFVPRILITSKDVKVVEQATKVRSKNAHFGLCKGCFWPPFSRQGNRWRNCDFSLLDS